MSALRVLVSEVWRSKSRAAHFGHSLGKITVPVGVLEFPLGRTVVVEVIKCKIGLRVWVLLSRTVERCDEALLTSGHLEDPAAPGLAGSPLRILADPHICTRSKRTLAAGNKCRLGRHNVASELSTGHVSAPNHVSAVAVTALK